jgi:hypothetical protein
VRDEFGRGKIEKYSESSHTGSKVTFHSGPKLEGIKKL